MSVNEKLLQEELSTLKVDFDKTKKSVETMEKEVITQRNNLNAIYGAMQQTEKLLKMVQGEQKADGKKV
tara:strand:- start:178 stop:384 length:207 start_codon:yes stop_codon:yes gene_type:complete